MANRINYSHAEALDLLRTLFNELWDEAGDFLEAINGILEHTQGVREFQGGQPTQRDGVDMTWEAAIEAWHDARKNGRGIPARQDVLDRMTATPEELCEMPGVVIDDEPNVLMVPVHELLCKFCNQPITATAHRHQGSWVGDCCWDERLRTTS